MPAPYTDLASVKKIVETPASLLDATIEEFIAHATLVVEEQLEGKGLSAARLAVIAQYLTAHYITILTERGGLTSQEVDDVKDTYGSPRSGSGLAMTRFGQQAIAFDTTGTLKAMAKDPVKAGLNAQFRVM